MKNLGREGLRLLLVTGKRSLFRTVRPFHIQLMLNLSLLLSSNATYEETSQAVKNGATLVTHLFNAMSSLSHRSPNLPGYVLSSASTSTSIPNPFFSMISDGIHLSPHIVRLSHRANPKACILITDALPPLDPSLSDGIYPWSRGRELIKEGDALYVKGSEVLAGR